MSVLYERIENLCKERNITITTMCKESGASRGSLTDLKAGRKQNLSVDTLTKIAIYFGVTVDYLAGNETKKAPAENNKRITDKYNIVKIAARNGSYLEKCLSDEDLAVITRIIDTLPDASDDL